MLSITRSAAGELICGILATSPRPPHPYPVPEHGSSSPSFTPPFRQAESHPLSRVSPRTGHSVSPNVSMTMHPQSTGEGRGVTSPDLPPYQPPQSGETGGAVNRSGDGLPDIIHSHYVGHALPPRPGQHHSAAAAASRHQRHRHHQHQGRGGGERSRGTRDDGGQNRRRRERRRTHSSSSATQAEDEGCKEPCLKCVAAVTSIRWLLLMMSLLGVLFVVAGIVMAVLHAIGNDFLVYALAFIGTYSNMTTVLLRLWACLHMVEVFLNQFLPTPFPSILVYPSAYQNLLPIIFIHQLLLTYLLLSGLDNPFCLHRPFTYVSIIYFFLKKSFCHFSFSL